MTDHRPGGEFLLFAGNTLLGRSELEWEDEAEGVWLRSGAFTPTDAYLQFQDLFQRHTREVSATRMGRRDRGPELNALAAQIEALQLHLFHPDGTEILVDAVEIQDCADTLSEDPRELEVEIRDKLVHGRFFSQPIA